MTLAVPPQGDLKRKLRNRPGRFAERMARPFFGLLTVAAGALGGLAGYAAWHASPAAGSGWTVAVAAGLAFPVILLTAAWLARNRRKLNRALWGVLVLAAGNAASLIGTPLTHPWQAGVVAMTIPIAAVSAAYFGWHAFAPGSAGFPIYLGIVARDRDEWRVALIHKDGLTETSSAAALTQAIDAVKTRVRELRPRRFPITGMQLLIMPWPDTGAGCDTWYRISGSPGRLTGAARGKQTVKGATIEELVAGLEATPGIDLPRTALWWPGGSPRQPPIRVEVARPTAPDGSSEPPPGLYSPR